MSTGTNAAPVTQQMEGDDIAALLSEDKKAFQDAQVVKHGCCYGPNLCGCMNREYKGRKFDIITEGFVESNDPVPCCCCCVVDRISKTFFDRQPFAPCRCLCCYPCGKLPAVVSDSDLECCCISCHGCHETCRKPFCGDTVSVVPCERDSCCFKCATKLFCWSGTPIFHCVENGEETAKKLRTSIEKSHAAKRKAGGAIGDPVGVVP